MPAPLRHGAAPEATEQLQRGCLRRNVGRRSARRVASGRDRGRRTSGHRRREAQEVKVVRVVRDGIEARRTMGVGEIRLVGVHGVAVGLDRIVVATDAKVDVSRHVHDVSRTRHQLRETFGTRQRTRGKRGFDGVDVEVACARMIAVLLECTLERNEDRTRARARRTRRGPVDPRREQHHRFGRERRDVAVVGHAVEETLHRIRIERVQTRPALRR
jgi:hypothetical protein